MANSHAENVTERNKFNLTKILGATLAPHLGFIWDSLHVWLNSHGKARSMESQEKEKDEKH